MRDPECVQFLQWALPQLRMRWPGFRKVRRQVCKRVDRRLRELELSDVEAYRAYLQSHRAEWSVLDSLCRISISRFYRDRAVFDYVRDDVLPTLATTAQSSNEQLRCWSAGCASGEEPYTVNILWKLHVATRFPEVGLRVIASDADSTMLDRARRGCYSRSSLKDVPEEWLTSAFTTADHVFCVKPEFRDGISFVQQDIRHAMPEGPFDLILCRHLVFTYFDEATQQETLQQILNRLAAGGILITGKQETLPTQRHELQPCESHLGAYRRRS